MNKPDVTGTWFETTAEINFRELLLPFRDRPNLRYLQIGVFNGDASHWLLYHVLTGRNSRLSDVDPWGSDKTYFENQTDIDMDECFRKYRGRLMRYLEDGHLEYFRQTSNQHFKDYGTEEYYDFVYVDGAHDAVHTLEDGIHAYRTLKPGGLLCFDDYTWTSPDRDPFKSPAPAINAIRFLYTERLIPLRFNSQAWFQKASVD